MKNTLLLFAIIIISCTKKNDPVPVQAKTEPLPYKYNYENESYIVVGGDTSVLRGSFKSGKLSSTRDTIEYMYNTVENMAYVNHKETTLRMYDMGIVDYYSGCLFVNDSLYSRANSVRHSYFKFKYKNIYYTVRDSVAAKIYPIYNRDGYTFLIKDVVLIEQAKVIYHFDSTHSTTPNGTIFQTSIRQYVKVSPDKSTDIKVTFRIIYQ